MSYTNHCDYRLEVNFTGTPSPVVQWFREGIEIQSSRDFQISVFIDKSYLFIPEVFPEDAGTFSVQVINQFGLVECRAVLIVEGKYNQPPETYSQLMFHLWGDIVMDIWMRERGGKGGGMGRKRSK